MLQAAQKAGYICNKFAESSTLVLDRSNIIRQTLETGNQLKDEASAQNPISAIYFDGRKDNTRVASGFVKEEHIALVSEPGAKYIGHVVTPTGCSEDQCNAISKYIQEDVNGGFDEVLVAGCDGTSSNTGWRGGLIRKLEEQN